MAVHSSNLARGNWTSTNWSGFAVTGATGSVTNVKGSWVVPAISGSCTSTNQYSSFWVGIDGFSSGTVEQIGTDSDCQNGSPIYYAWYEFYPKPAFRATGLTIHPGDVIRAEVSASGKTFTVSLTDVTTGQSFSKTTRGTPPRSLRQSGSQRLRRAAAGSSHLQTSEQCSSVLITLASGRPTSPR